MTTNYQKGYRFERKIATYFRRRGYFVVRSGGSKGPADLVGVKKNVPTLLIQCKAGTGVVGKDEHNTLFRAAQEAGARAIIVSKEDRKTIVYKAVTGIALKTGDAEVVIKGV
jgi:Holliday junction resolvase